jgi:hypothetical protein
MGENDYLRIAAMWMTPPWCRSGVYVESEEIQEDFGVPAELTAEVEEWEKQYQDLMDSAYPPDSREFTSEERTAFLAQGRELAKRVRQFVPAEIEVIYGGMNWELDERF